MNSPMNSASIHHINLGPTAKAAPKAGRHLIIDMTSCDKVQFSGSGGNEAKAPSRKDELYASGGRKIVQSFLFAAGSGILYGGALAALSLSTPLGVGLAVGGMAAFAASGICSAWGTLNLIRGFFAKG